MSDWSRREFVATLPILAAGAILPGAKAEDTAEIDADALVMVVMDPLALPLSCPCVKGYAQRKYDALAEWLSNKLGRNVHPVFSESLTHALKHKSHGRADLVIGKCSVVKQHATESKLALAHIAMLTGKDGKTTQTGLIVVPAKDPAKAVADLKGYRILFGTPDADEKYAAPIALLKQHGVEVPETVETCAACSDGATIILEAGEKVRGAAVISSYAKPLLEGCGTIQKGDLRVVGETEPLPFIGAFLNDELPADLKKQVQAELLNVLEDVELCLKIESRRGFVALADETAKKKS
jgi:ABC-type phosphate/phosphonate transport system substrate-binding protein